MNQNDPKLQEKPSSQPQQKTQQKTTSRFREGPQLVVQELVLIKSHSVKDFLKPDLSGREMMKPYWIYSNGFMEFDYISERTDQAELLELIRAGRVYYRHPECNMRVRELESYPEWSDKECKQ